MPKTIRKVLYNLAEPMHGYFTTKQAEAIGISPPTIVKMADRGMVERISRGVYRLAEFPPHRHGQYVEAVLWPEGGLIGTLSHESALAFHQLSDVSPNKVHITLPPVRIRRAIPPYMVIHRVTLPPEDVRVQDGVPVTTPARAIRDCFAGHLGRRLVAQAIDDGVEAGKITRRQAEHLRKELLTREVGGTRNGNTKLNRKASTTTPRAKP